MMFRQRHRLRIDYGLAIALWAALVAQPGFAEEAASTAHGDSKASPSPAPSSENSSRRSVDEDVGKGAAKADDKHPSRGDDGRTQQGDRGHVETHATGKNPDTGAPSASNPTDIDTRISVQPRRLGAKPDRGRSAIESPLSRRLQRQTAPVPRNPNVPVLNAIGVPVQQPAHAERRDFTRPAPVAMAPATPAGATAVPSNAGIHINRAEGAPDHHIAITTPAIVPPVANRAAINGTGLTHPSVGPPLIGGPKAAVAGVNGTMIKPKH